MLWGPAVWYPLSKVALGPGPPPRGPPHTSELRSVGLDLDLRSVASRVFVQGVSCARLSHVFHFRGEERVEGEGLWPGRSCPLKISRHTMEQTGVSRSVPTR